MEGHALEKCGLTVVKRGKEEMTNEMINDGGYMSSYQDI